MDTIFALATVPGRAGVAIVRVSGPLAGFACKALCGDIPKGRGVRKITDPQCGEVLDTALVLWFDKGSSFTGDPTVEFHLHGSRAVVTAVLASLSNIENLRLAEAGEFTRRALENGQLDLAEVEGLADLIDAETEAQRRQAIRVFSGKLGEAAAEWRRRLIYAASLLEASIDFADEDIPEDVVPDVMQTLDQLVRAFQDQIDGVKAAERIRDGFEVAIVGKPNAGKSTLLNYLSQRQAALTSDIPGTTRDVIEVRMDIGGHAVTLLDTAGVRTSDDKVEQLGIDLAKDRAERADLRIFLIEPGEAPVLVPRSNDIVVVSKADTLETSQFSVSGKTGAGVEALFTKLTVELNAMVGGAGLAIRERHRIALVNAQGAVEKAKTALSSEVGLDIAAEELRYGVKAVSSIIGHVDVEDLLDEIFSSFCIGK